MPTISERIATDIITAMKAKEADKLTTLRMVKAALQSKEIDKRAALDEAEQQAVLTTMLKQRRDSVEQFTKGNRPELAAKEQAEIAIIDAYMPQAAGEDEIRTVVQSVISHLTADACGVRPPAKEMGTVMKVVRQRLLANGVRADGKVVSDIIKEELAKSE